MNITIPRPAAFTPEEPPPPSPDGIECPLCGNRGYTTFFNEAGELMTRECSCMARRRSVRRAKASGLGDLLERCTFKTMACPDDWAKQLKAAALRYCQSPPGTWFYVSGRPGVGKTHACAAICRRLMERGQEVRYFLWREQAPVLKALVGDSPDEYAARMERLAAVPVLFIDDLFKGSVSDADLNLAFALINARYNRTNSRTVFSSERPLSEIRRLDEATGSRIFQRAADYILNAPPGAKNWRTE